jgi:nitroreductase
MKIINKRKTNYDVNSIFPKRWSPRALSGEKITKTQLMKLFEAARWSPSSYNNQSWRFIYAMKGTKQFQTLFKILAPPNQVWCKNASVLIVIVSKKTFDYNKKPSITHSFDTGAAWMSLALQASMSGLVAHGMQGLDYVKAQKQLNIPKDYQVEAMCAIGKKGKKSLLPKEMQAIEMQSDRKPITKIAFEGKFKR